MARRKDSSKKKTASTPRRPAPAPPKRPAWRWAALGVLAAAVVAVIALAMGRRPAPAPVMSLAEARRYASADWLAKTRIRPSTVTPAWPYRLKPPVAALASASRPTVLYIGADYCPYCAAERWALAVALSRFGHFSRLLPMRSSATDVYPNTATWTFYGARYQSRWLRFVPFEIATRQGPTHPLERVTEPYQRVWFTHDAPPYVSSTESGSIPFVLVGGQYMWIGTSYSPAVLKGLSWDAVIRDTETGRGGAGAFINANANALTAAICLVDGRRPATVCSDPAIRTLEHGFGEEGVYP